MRRCLGGVGGPRRLGSPRAACGPGILWSPAFSGTLPVVARETLVSEQAGGMPVVRSCTAAQAGGDRSCFTEAHHSEGAFATCMTTRITHAPQPKPSHVTRPLCSPSRKHEAQPNSLTGARGCTVAGQLGCTSAAQWPVHRTQPGTWSLPGRPGAGLPAGVPPGPACTHRHIKCLVDGTLHINQSVPGI